MKMRDFSRAGEIFLVDPELIEEREGYNIRDLDSPEVQEHIRKMANAIHESGTSNFPPISVQIEGDKMFVVSGHCRRRAHVLAKQEAAPVQGIRVVQSKLNEHERVIDLLTSNDGLPLTQLQKAKVVKRLVDFDWSIAEIAKKMGVTHRVISDLLILLEAPQEIKTLVEDNKISATLAVETMKEDSNAVQTLNTAVENATKQGKKRATKRHIETKVKEVKLDLKLCPFCGDQLVRDEEAELWRHEEAYCYLSGATVSETEKEDWNQRVR